MGEAIPDTPMARKALERLRRICAALPETAEVVTWGHPTFRTGGIGFKTDLDEQTLLCMDDRFFVSPYVGQHGWTSLRLVGRPPWGEIERLVEGSFRRIAKKRLVARWEASRRSR